MKYNAETIEKILANDITRYLFLVSLISSDTLSTKDDYLNSLETFDYIYNNMNEMSSLTDEIRTELTEFIFKGKEIINIVLKEIT